MKLEGYLETYYWFSGKASDVARQLAFAGVAIIWIFKTGDGLQAKIPDKLLLPLTLLCLSLVFDLLQYITGTIIWGIFHRHHESKPADKNIKASVWLMRPILFFFVLKIILVSTAFIIMIRFFGAMVSAIT